MTSEKRTTTVHAIRYSIIMCTYSYINFLIEHTPQWNSMYVLLKSLISRGVNFMEVENVYKIYYP